MCEECVKNQYPDRDNMCLDNGAYLFNYGGCKSCHAKHALKVADRVVDEDEDGQQLITYKHVCNDCGHVVANHEYKFEIEEEYQNYEMSCLLCGQSEDQRSIMPNDPRQQVAFY